MQRAPTTTEEQIFLKCIREECPWENLPKRLQSSLATKEEWHRRIADYCIRKRLQWNTCFARKVCKEGEYYEDMMRYLRKNLALFPYHLSEYICRVMRLSPFRYYCDILFEVMKNEQPYDSIPNFSAADALRLTGIGRNEFIDIMNKCRSKKIMWKLNKSIAKELLPTQPVDFVIEPWWGVCLVNFTLEEFKKLTEEEAATIDKICKEEANSYFLFDSNIIKGLYQRGLVYFDVPVYPDDRFKVSRLEGFVSNREQSYEDPIEELLYAVFVVSSENATVSELATTLQADLFQLQSAASFACRLGWAVKLIDLSAVLGDSSLPNSGNSLSDEEDVASSDYLPQRHPGSGPTRISLIVDANITSYLMMGSLSPGLKSHAVTLYEAGKLDDASISELCKDLASLEGTKFEGELQEFANHAFSLRRVLQCLQLGGNREESEARNLESNMESLDLESKSSEESNPSFQVNILRCESLATLAPATLDRLFLRDYDIVMSMIPLPSSSVLPGSNGAVHLGPPSYASMTPWMKLVLYSSMSNGPLSVILMKGQCLRMLPAPLLGCEKALIWSWDKSVIGGLGGKYEGDLVNGSILLHCLNSLLKYSAVLVQPLNKVDLDPSGKPVTVDFPLPLKNSKGSVASIEETGLSMENTGNLNVLLHEISNSLDVWNTGYIRLLRLSKEREKESEERYEWVPLGIEFGIPLFNPELCGRICERVVSSRLLNNDLVTEHHDSMKSIRRKLNDICLEYHAIGPAAKILYQKEEKIQPKDSSRKLINYASGRWNSFSESSVANLGNQRLKFGNRQRCGGEILSFDGNVLRSYALSPVYEDETKPFDESIGSSSVKVESEDSEKKEVILPGVNLIFDGTKLLPFDIGACLQARQPVMLIAEASSISASSHANRS